jgi:hypothetical protein
MKSLLHQTVAMRACKAIPIAAAAAAAAVAVAVAVAVAGGSVVHSRP